MNGNLVGFFAFVLRFQITNIKYSLLVCVIKVEYSNKNIKY